MAYPEIVSKQVSATALRQNLYRILDEILATGESVEIVRKGSDFGSLRGRRPGGMRAVL